MIRNIIEIDEAKCVGCGLCANACHQGAIEIIDGKAKLVKDDYCDGLGMCLPSCPTDAIKLVEKDVVAFDANHDKKTTKEKPTLQIKGQGCPGHQIKTFERNKSVAGIKQTQGDMPSQLRQWPVQIKLAPLNAPYFENANLLIAADCSAFSHGNFHQEFMRNHVTLIGCPKLDTGDYAEKLTEIIKTNTIKSLKVVRMEVPCCGGIERAAVTALKNSGKFIPWQVITLSTNGEILE